MPKKTKIFWCAKQRTLGRLVDCSLFWYCPYVYQITHNLCVCWIGVVCSEAIHIICTLAAICVGSSQQRATSNIIFSFFCWTPASSGYLFGHPTYEPIYTHSFPHLNNTLVIYLYDIGDVYHLFILKFILMYKSQYECNIESYIFYTLGEDVRKNMLPHIKIYIC
jgi:hypothetical protein